MRTVQFVKVSYSVSVQEMTWPLPDGWSIPGLGTELFFDGRGTGLIGLDDLSGQAAIGWIDEGSEPGGYWAFIQTGIRFALISATAELVTVNLDQIGVDQVPTQHGTGPMLPWQVVGSPRFPDSESVVYAGQYAAYRHVFWKLDPLFTDGADTVNFRTMSANEASWWTGYQGGDGGDRVTLPDLATFEALNAQGIFVPLYFHGEAGRDTIIGGDSGNEIWGGDDGDSLIGGGGLITSTVIAGPTISTAVPTMI